MIDRGAVSPENGMPTLSCATQDLATKMFKVGRALGQFPMFYKNGRVGYEDGSRFTRSRDRYPLCGNAKQIDKVGP
jgi:hypothetical protein